ncbi:MAG: DUF1573 domain-containing protein [Desulfobacteraceae bacterium]|nr:DUF1573 domain-containing protein [Desulfobacteraceae bacterium]
MKTKTIVTLTVVCCILFSAMSYADDKTVQPTPAASVTAPSETVEKVPVAVIPEEKYEFKAVAEGVEIVHDFVIQNKGTADLEILAVRPG